MEQELAFDAQMAAIVSLMWEGGIVRHDDAVGVLRRHLIRHTLRRHNGNVTQAAAELGVHRNTVMRYMLDLGIRREEPVKA